MKIQLVALAPLLAAACAPLPELDMTSAFAAASDPAVGTTPAQDGPVISYTPRKIGEPGNWLDLNYEQAEGAE